VKSQVFKSVWDAIANTPEEAENLNAREALTYHIRARIEKEGLTQVKAAALFGVTQPACPISCAERFTCSVSTRA
jgi:predicted XRE-type DNA-binding protein